MTMTFGAKKMKSGDEDQRYRLSIILVADKRPKYWDFHCVKCRQKIVELSGDVMSISDVADLSAIPEYAPAPLSIECKGSYCRIWYEFVTLSGTVVRTK
jgi:hypothetical protein